MVGLVPPTPLGGNPQVVVPSCQANINRIKLGNGAPANWKLIAKNLTAQWTDPSFDATNYRTWGVSYSNGVAASLISTTYQRLRTTTPTAVLFNPKTVRRTFDIR